MKEFKLDNYQKTAGFKIPENYFEELPEKVLAVISQKENKVISLFGNTKWIYTVAAVLVLSLIIPLLNNFCNDLTQSDADAIENYIAYADISESDIVEHLDANDLVQINVGVTPEDKIVEDLLSTNSELEKYLIN